MDEILNTFFLLSLHTIKILVLLPIVFFIIGYKINSKLLKDLSIKLFIFLIFLAIILTVFDFIK